MKRCQGISREENGGMYSDSWTIASTYWWKCNVETTEEGPCLIKSKRDLYDELGKAIKEMHTYEIPEIIAMPLLLAVSTIRNGSAMNFNARALSILVINKWMECKNGGNYKERVCERSL